MPSPAVYAELQVTTNFSFLEGASHPHELVVRAAELGLSAIAITDRNSLAGIVRSPCRPRTQREADRRLPPDFHGRLARSPLLPQGSRGLWTALQALDGWKVRSGF
jgi:hypothetical protein